MRFIADKATFFSSEGSTELSSLADAQQKSAVWRFFVARYPCDMARNWRDQWVAY
jgi:hypothetical protein